MSKKPLVITQLEVVDFKKIKAISIDPETKKPVILTGDNGQGKSSAIDAIVEAMVGGAATKPIRDGAEKTTIRLTMDDGDERKFFVEKKITEKGGYLDVRDADERKVPKPAAFLKSLVGNLAFDPERFVRMKPKERSDALKQASGLDLGTIEEETAEAFTERTVVGRQLDKATVLKKQLGPKPAVPPAPEDFTEILTKKHEAEATLKAHVELGDKLDRNEKKETALEERRAELEKKLAECVAEIDETEKENLSLRAEWKEGEAEAEKAKEFISTADERIAESKGAAAKRAEWDKEMLERKNVTAQYNEVSQNYHELDTKIAELRAQKEEAIKSAKMPVDGISFDDKGVVLFDGIPFEDLNTAKQWEVAARIAMAQNPDLGVIVIKEGALIRESIVDAMAALAAENGFQLWIETFSETPREKGIHIIDGCIAFEDGQPVSEELL